MTVAMALYNAKAEAIGNIIIQPNQEIFFICSLFCSRFGHGYCSGQIMAMAMVKASLFL